MRNLISLSMLESNGYNFKSKNGHLHVLKDAKTIMIGVRDQSLYYLMAEAIVGKS